MEKKKNGISDGKADYEYPNEQEDLDMQRYMEDKHGRWNQ